MKLLSKLYPRKKTGSQILAPGTLCFTCNICGSSCIEQASRLSREEISCMACGSTVRMRGIIHALSIGLFGKPIKLPDFELNKSIVGCGMSDWEKYAIPLSKKLSYTNTYYHKDPKLDITNVSNEYFESLDFLISTDVFEHVAPPVSLAFSNAMKMLKPAGVFILSVPYTLEAETLEHFPNLHIFDVKNIKDVRTLVNKRKDGVEEHFEDLVFHGSSVGGETLEMRVFSEKGLLQDLTQAGFEDIQIMKDSYFEYGIHWTHPWSVPVIARKKGIPIRIQNWGPQSMSIKSPPNLQSNGQVGLWLKVSGLLDDLDIELRVDDAVMDALILKDDLITTFIPLEVLQSIGSKPIVIVDLKTGASLYVGSLVVTV